MENKNDVIEIRNLNKWYGDFHVLKDINLNVKKGEIIVVAGPSGSGKSTLIRCINYLEQFQEGQIIVNDIELSEDIKKIKAIREDVAMVFQHFNLFPHLSILDNLTLAPIWVKKMPKKRCYKNCDELSGKSRNCRSGKKISKPTQWWTATKGGDC